MHSLQQMASDARQAALNLAVTDIETRNAALLRITESLYDHREEIFMANHLDLQQAEEEKLAAPMKLRLAFHDKKLSQVIRGIQELITMPDPLGMTTLSRELANGLNLYRVTCPIGVIGVVFESRPDALVQIATLCLKSGNCAVLKGGKETAETNRVLFTVIYDAAVAAGLPEGCLLLAEQHSEIDELLTCDKEVDLLIPRGSNAFVRYIMDHTKIPVMGHADGICHIYVDKDADQDKAIRVIIDAKTQYTAACNAVETILIDRAIAGEFLPKLKAAFDAAGIKMRGTAEVSGYVPCEVMAEDAFATEYLDLIASVKLVDGAPEAVRHINYFGSHHTDSIMTENEETAAYFTQMVDSAGVYVNVSTRFADGFRYGFGAEVGISTGKIHARGPVGLEGLVTYKYRLTGDGHIVGDYASGKRAFHHRDL